MLSNERVAGEEHGSGSRAGDKTRIPVDLGELDRQRLIRGWSKKDLAEAIGVVPETVSELYRLSSASPALFAKLKLKFAERAIEEVAARLMGEQVA